MCRLLELPRACCGLQSTRSFSLRHSICVPYQAYMFILVPFHDVSNFWQRDASYRCLGMEMLTLWALVLVYINAFQKFSFAEPFSSLKYFTEPHPCFWVGNTKKKESVLLRLSFYGLWTEKLTIKFYCWLNQ